MKSDYVEARFALPFNESFCQYVLSSVFSSIVERRFIDLSGKTDKRRGKVAIARLFARHAFILRR
jgi:hypothetical protein